MYGNSFPLSTNSFIQRYESAKYSKNVGITIFGHSFSGWTWIAQLAQLVGDNQASLAHPDCFQLGSQFPDLRHPLNPEFGTFSGTFRQHSYRVNFFPLSCCLILSQLVRCGITADNDIRHKWIRFSSQPLTFLSASSRNSRFYIFVCLEINKKSNRTPTANFKLHLTSVEFLITFDAICEIQ